MASLEPVVVEIPLRLQSELNVREHWSKRANRARVQRSAVSLVLRARFEVAGVPGRVTITRLAPRALDTDNLAGACKHVRDGVADWLGIDDKDPSVSWVCEQEKSKSKRYGVRVKVEWVNGSKSE